MGAEVVHMGVQDCGSRIVETVMHEWEQKQKRWKRRCKIRNSRDGSQDVGAETIKMEVQVWVSRNSREWKCWCGSRDKQYKDAVQGEAERWRWQCRRGSRNSRDGSAGVEA